MANSHSLWRRFLNGFRSDRKHHESDRNRRTRFEPLERRNLLALNLISLDMLALDSMASINGTVYLDQTGDGLSGDDTLLNGVTVELFDDTGTDIGTFDSGDTQVGGEVTGSIGEYLFDNLTEGVYFVVQQSAGYVQQPGDDVVTVTISATDVQGELGEVIDTFNGTTQDLQAIPTSTPDESAVADIEAIGGDRFMSVDVTSPTGALWLSANPSHTPGVLTVTGTVGSTGTRTLIWDGIDGLPTDPTIDYTGLGSIDLVEGGLRTGMQLDIGAGKDGGVAKLTVYTDAANWSSLSIPIPDTDNGILAGSGYLAFDNFIIGAGTGADFENVGAIMLEIEGDGSIDVQMDQMSAVGPTVLTADFANFQPVSLGNQVFNDLNDNGVFDSATETGIENVALTLWEDINSNDVLDIGTDVEISSTTTDVDGLYSFDLLFPSDYIVEVDQSNFNSGNPLEGFLTSAGNDPAPDPDDDVNHDDNGFTSLGRLVTHAVTLATGAEPLSDGDSDGNDDDSNFTVDFGFAPQIDLVITKSGPSSSVALGDQFDYTLEVTNNGPAIATGVTVVDTLPDDVTFVSATPVQTDLTGSVLTFDLGTIANGASQTITIRVQVDSDATSPFTNNAQVDGDVARADETNPNNNQASAVTTLTEIIDLGVVKSDSVDPVLVGENLTYTLTVTNYGPTTATGVTLTDTLPGNVTFVSASLTYVTFVSGVLTFDLPDLDTDDSTSVTIVVNVDSDATTTLTNFASVTGDQPDNVSANDTTQEDTALTIQSDLAITKTGSQTTVETDDVFTYTIRVTNNGPSDATGVTVVDTLPEGVTFISASNTNFTQTATDMTFNLGAIANGEFKTFTIDVSVDSDAPETLLNTAVVDGIEVDPVSSNNTADVTTTVGVELSSIAGFVYLDQDNDGVFDPTEQPISGVLVRLTRTDITGIPDQTQTTGADGSYLFEDLTPGTYTLTETQPSAYPDGQDTLGTPAQGTSGDDVFTEIVLESGVDAEAFNFGELLPTVSKRMFLAST